MFDRRSFLGALRNGATALLFFALGASSALSDEVVLIEAEQFQVFEHDLGGRLGVAIWDLETGSKTGWRADERFAMNSTFKFMLVAATLKRIENGDEQFDRSIDIDEADLVPWAPVTEKHIGQTMTIRELCSAVMTKSDNLATNYLLKAMGGPAKLTAFLRDAGDDVSISSRYEPEANAVGQNDDRDTSTPNAMVSNLERFVLGSTLSKSSRAQLFDWMVENTTGLKRIRGGLPDDWNAGDRTGTGSGGRASNIAIAYPPGRAPVLFAVYTDGSHRYPRDISKVHAEIGRLVSERIIKGH